MQKHTCIYAHYNSSGRVDRYIITYLEALHTFCETIIFVSNSPIDDESRQKLQYSIPEINIIERPNTGFDFGAWQHAINLHLIPADTTNLILTNDSIFGPLFNLENIVSQMSSKPDIDFWGLSDSYQGRYHIQSFFICLSEKVFLSQAFATFFKQNFNSCTKQEIINKGEVIFTSALLDAGFLSGVLASAKKFDSQAETHSSYAKNPTHSYWQSLIREYHFPFIKKELILLNPENLQSVEEVFDTLEKVSDYDVENIKDFLIRAYEKKRVADSDIKVVVLCHLFYPQTIYYFLLKLSAIKSYKATFIFNLSSSLQNDRHFRDVLTASFPGAIVLHSPAQGRDIGGKMVALDAMLKAHISSDYALVIHDKLSLHSAFGGNWRDKLFSILHDENLPRVFNKFKSDRDAGIIAAKGLVQNEYNPDENNFRCTSSENILNYISEYDLRPTSYQFVAGTIFWIRTELLQSFFKKYSPLAVRLTLEKGNVLDFAQGTNIHAWERVFSFIANTGTYKIKEL